LPLSFFPLSPMSASPCFRLIRIGFQCVILSPENRGEAACLSRHVSLPSDKRPKPHSNNEIYDRYRLTPNKNTAFRSVWSGPQPVLVVPDLHETMTLTLTVFLQVRPPEASSTYDQA
jgi:hypothetical protein